MSEYVRRIMPYGSCDILETQQWLEEMSAKGLHFVSSGYFFAKFRKGEPKQMRYRLDFCDVVACDIPEEKREMYEAGGWHVIGDYKSGSIVLRTEDTDATEIYTEPEALVKPIKHMASRMMEICAVLAIILFAVLYYEIGRYKSCVDALLACSVSQFALLTAVELILLLQLLHCLAQYIRLRKLLNAARVGDFLPHGERRKVAVLGSLVSKFGIVAELVCAAVFAFQLFCVGIPNETAEICALELPNGEEFGWEFDDERGSMYISHTAAGDIIHCSRYGDVTYIVDRYELRSTAMALKMADTIEYDRDFIEFSGSNETYADEYADARIFYSKNVVNERFNTQILYIQYENRFMRLLCESTDIDFGSREVCSLYITALKSAK